MQVLFRQPHLDEALTRDNICGTVVVNEDSTHVVSGEVDGVLANVDTDDEGSLCG